MECAVDHQMIEVQKSEMEEKNGQLRSKDKTTNMELENFQRQISRSDLDASIESVLIRLLVQRRIGVSPVIQMDCLRFWRSTFI